MIHVCMLMLLAAAPEKVAKPIETTVEELIETNHQFNEALMDEKFTAKRVQLSGRVVELQRNQNRGYTLSLSDGSMSDEQVQQCLEGNHLPPQSAIEIHFNSSERSGLAKLQQYQSITVTGIVGLDRVRRNTFTGLGDQSVILMDCKIIDAKPMKKPELGGEETTEKKVRR